MEQERASALDKIADGLAKRHEAERVAGLAKAIGVCGCPTSQEGLGKIPSNVSDEIRNCSRCGNQSSGLHSCPFVSKIGDNDDPEYCNCCDACTHECCKETDEQSKNSRDLCYALDWSKGCPQEPGVYLLRFARGHGLEGLPLLLRLSEPDAYDWFVVTVFRDEEYGWLEYVSPRDGSTRVLSSEFGKMNVWWSRLQ